MTVKKLEYLEVEVRDLNELITLTIEIDDARAMAIDILNELNMVAIDRLEMPLFTPPKEPNPGVDGRVWNGDINNMYSEAHSYGKVKSLADQPGVDFDYGDLMGYYNRSEM